MDAVEFLKEADRMHNFGDHDCAECEVNKRRGDNLSCVNWVLNHPTEAVEIVERWAKEHPRKTRQSEFLKLFPRVSMTADGIIAFCPDSMDSEFECPRKTRDNIDPICGECRMEYWFEEVEGNDQSND